MKCEGLKPAVAGLPALGGILRDRVASPLVVSEVWLSPAGAVQQVRGKSATVADELARVESWLERSELKAVDSRGALVRCQAWGAVSRLKVGLVLCGRPVYKGAVKAGIEVSMVAVPQAPGKRLCECGAEFVEVSALVARSGCPECRARTARVAKGHFNGCGVAMPARGAPELLQESGEARVKEPKHWETIQSNDGNR